MPDLNDFYAFKNSSSGGGNGRGSGCSGSTLLWIVVILGILYFVGKCSS